jgi:hypothetical protein
MRLQAVFGWLAVVTSGSVAQAHISLDTPTSRYFLSSSRQADQNKLKSGPCGASGDKRTTNTALITPFKPGEKITVTWRETIQHPGHFRIAFDNDGQDFPLPGEALPTGVVVLADNIADKSGASGLSYSQDVTLPNIECSNCTLQLIQVMTTGDPPYKAGDLYFNCADIVLSSTTSSSVGGSSAVAASGGSSTVGASSAGGTRSIGLGGAAIGGAAIGGAATGVNRGGTGGALATGATNSGGTNAATSGSASMATAGGSGSSARTSASSNTTSLGGIGGTSASLSSGTTQNGSGGTTAVEMTATRTSATMGGTASASASVTRGDSATVTGGSSTTLGGDSPNDTNREPDGCTCQLPKSPIGGWSGLAVLGLLWSVRRKHGRGAPSTQSSA